MKVVEYFSFHCPHCIALFRKDFSKIRSDILEKEGVYWEFHPVPLDMVTVQAMACLSKLSDTQKQLFLEVILEESDLENPLLTTVLMKKAMEVFKVPLPDLEEKEFLTNQEAFQEAFEFIQQEDIVEAIPSVEINGTLYQDEVPEYSFIKNQIEKEKKNA